MSGGPLVVAVDCSTTAAKAVVADASGAVVATGAAPLTTATPAPGFHEQDATAWFDATLAAVGSAVGALTGADRARVTAMAITHQRESFVLLDADGAPLRPAILWVDSRASKQIARLGSQPLPGGRSVHDVSGKPPDTTPAIYKLAWLAEHEPGVVARAAYLADVQAYLALRLTGRLATSHASADTLGLFDLEHLTWSPALLTAAGLDAAGLDAAGLDAAAGRPRVSRRGVSRGEAATATSQDARPGGIGLPTLVAGGEAIGGLLPDVAERLGLEPGVTLVAGIGDGQSAGIALGVEEPGVAYLNLGTSMVCGVAAGTYLTSPAFRTLAGVRPGTYILETVLNAAAYVADWAARFAGSDVTTMETAAAAVPPGAEGLLVLPYWNAAQTPHWDPLARGAVVGWHGRHTPAHLYRAVLEGVAFELRLQLGLLEAATGTSARELRAVGGGARSPLWAQVVASVTGRRVRVCADGEVSAAGAAIQAHAWIAGPADAGPSPVNRFVAAGHDIVPEPGDVAVYDGLYPAYATLYPALRETFARLSGA
ncbi:xylulose kinase [Xylanimonas allomyrinae]|uniref:Xylulose kinase n=1 Tax=Xylanimonas allomyrinae TaxID=2509459 RepID=A0A4V0YED5_9MICO|nr:FGGY family carbohydrate kinase [Xylanimonas allomyrinae]QAY63831.1 xylulose kinase [Xylanimonas allomyrinae]